MVGLRRITALIVASLFAASATLYVASVPRVVAAPLAQAAADAGTADHGGCHGMAGEEQAPAHPPAKTSSCCDIACHAWLAPALSAVLRPPPAAGAPVMRIAAFDPQPAPGIDRPPRP